MTSHTCTPAWVSSLHLNSCSSNAIFACSAMAALMYSCSSNVPARSNVSSECILCGDSKGSELQQPSPAMPSARRSRSPRQRHPAGAEVLRLCNMLAQAGVPCIAVQLRGLVVLSKSWSKYDKLSHHSLLDAVEFFAGAETVASAFCARGFKTLGYDILLDSGSMDIMSAPGMAFALALSLRLRRGSFAHLAPVCSSLVWVSRSSTGRSETTPLGTTACAREGNAMTSRCMLLMYILISRGVLVVLGQPSSSLMQYPSWAKQFLYISLAQFELYVWS